MRRPSWGLYLLDLLFTDELIEQARMNLMDLLKQERQKVLEMWRERILASYPADGMKYFDSEKDRFLNPVGTRITESVEAVFEEFVKGQSSERLSEALDGIVQIRAVQDFTPAAAVGFVYQFKQVVREVLDGHLADRNHFEQLLEIESAVDAMALLAFERYMLRRERIFQIRANEIKRQSQKLQERTNNEDLSGTD